MRVLLMGPPGAGKGTQGLRLAARHGVVMISTGELFRAHVRDRTNLGRQIAAIVDSGDYVPDELTNAVVRDRLGRPDAAAGFVLDGYPRTLGQVTELDAILSELGIDLDAVVELGASDDEVIGRLMVRDTESRRSDDSPDVVLKRLAIYHEQAAPLRDDYKRRGLLIEIDGSYPPDEVERQIAASIRSVAPAGS
ncbi:adenylate kinase [Lacisediminihabitans sp. FW035]